MEIASRGVTARCFAASARPSVSTTPARFQTRPLPCRTSTASPISTIARARPVPSPGPALLPQPQSRCLYIPRPKKGQAAKPRPDLHFAAADVPGSSVWEQKRRALEKAGMDPGAQRLDAAACVAEAVRFADEVSKAGPGWRPIRAKDLGFSAADLYYMAALLRTPPIERPAVLRLTKQMLASASEMGHGPAVVSMAHLALHEAQRSGAKGLPARAGAPEFWAIVDRFGRYAQTAPGRRDPDALTLAAMLAAAAGDRARALRCLLDAQGAARPAAPPSDAAGPRRPPRWDLEAQALLTLGVLQAAAGDAPAARAAYAAAAWELDMPEACLRLALLLPADDERQREVLLARAAMSGVEGAFAPLAELARRRAARAPEGPAARHALLVAEEWDRLAAAVDV